jgi:hypothetical protein
MRPIQFRRERLSLEQLHPRLKDFVRQFDDLAELLDAPPTVVTCTERTVEENAKAGGVPTSLHVRREGETTVRAVDLRNNHYSDLERQILAGALQLWAIKYKDFDVVVRNHGTGPHFHLEWEGP